MIYQQWKYKITRQICKMLFNKMQCLKHNSQELTDEKYEKSEA
jgi:hypothetical protein